MDPGDADREELADRVEQLEEESEQHRHWLKQMMPGRRGVLAGGAGLLAGSALTGGASGQTAAGQVGTQNDPVDVEAVDVTADAIETANLDTTQGHGVLGLPNHHINYESGLSNEEVARFTLSSGDTLDVWRLESTLKGGGSNANVTVEIYDETDATVVESVTAGERKEGGDTPLGSSTAGATILVRLSTGSSSVDLTNTALISVGDS